MDPITIGLLVIAGLFVVSAAKPSPVQQAAHAQSQGRMPPAAGPDATQPADVVDAMLHGAQNVAGQFQHYMAGTMDNILAQRLKQAGGPTGGGDPAYVDSGSASSARDFIQRGLTGAVGAAGAAYAGTVGRTATGQAAAAAAGKTGAELVAAGKSVAAAGQQAVANAADATAQAANNADEAAARWIAGTFGG